MTQLSPPSSGKKDLINSATISNNVDARSPTNTFTVNDQKTQQFLSKQIGQVIKAKVIQATDITSKTQGPNIDSLQSGRQDNIRQQTVTTPAKIAPVFEVIMQNGKQLLRAETTLLPKVGVSLLLNVNNSSTLTIASSNNDSFLLSNQVNTSQNISSQQSTSGTNPKPQSPIQSSLLGIPQIQQQLRTRLPLQINQKNYQQEFNNVFSVLKQLSGQNNNFQTPNSSKSTNNLNTVTKNPLFNNPNIANTQINNPLEAKNLSQTAQNNTSSNIASSTSQISTQNLVTLTTIIPKLKSSLIKLTEAIPKSQDLYATNNIKKAIQNNGIFYESKISKLISSENNTNTVLPKEITEDNRHLQLKIIDEIKHFLRKTELPNNLTKVISSNSALQPLLQTPEKAILNNDLLSFLLHQNNVHQLSDYIQLPKPDADNLFQLLKTFLGIINRGQAQQLTALNSQASAQLDLNQNQLLQFEIPVWHNNQYSLIDIVIEHQKKEQEKNKTPSIWKVKLRFDLKELGELTAIATLKEKTLTAVFWASQPELASLVDGEIKNLNSNFENLGINVQEMLCRVGHPSNENDNQAFVSLSEQLINTRS